MSDRVVLWGMQNPVRGLLHGASAALALVGTVGLQAEAGTTVSRIGFAVFGAALVALLLTSALYHSVPWAEGAMRRMQRLDHSMIFLVIAATFTPFGLLTLDGWLRVAALASAWGLASVGIAAVAAAPGRFPGRRVGAMIGLGWLSTLVAIPVERHLGTGALTLLAAGGVAYSVGGLLFAYRWPRLWPRLFSYHELFHALVVVAAALHFAAVWYYLVPLSGARG